jgi:hypothetical protein
MRPLIKGKALPLTSLIAQGGFAFDFQLLNYQVTQLPNSQARIHCLYQNENKIPVTTPLLAAFIHVASELAFILNSTRLLPSRKGSGYETPQTAAQTVGSGSQQSATV